MSTNLSLARIVLARLRSLPNITIYDNENVTTAPPGAFAIYRDSDDQLFAGRVDGGRRRYRWEFQTICAGRDQEQARWCIRQVRNALANWRVDGSMLTEVDNGAALITDTTIPDDVRVSRTLEFRLYTHWS